MNFPIGVQSFEVIRNEGFVYVDKTDLIYSLARKKQVFLARPRRFGKSLTLSTLDAYFSGRKELFEGLKINDYETEWKKYAVLKISFNGARFDVAGELQKTIYNFFDLQSKKYGFEYNEKKTSGDNLRALLALIHQQTDEPVVMLVDEYDKPLMDCLGNVDLYNTHHSILRSFYSAFKDADIDLKFIMLTGVTKIAKLNVFSGMNQIEDITFDTDFETLCGFTEKELYSVFAEPIKVLAKNNKMKIKEMKQLLKINYDGYCFSGKKVSIYNPFSIINVFTKNKLDNYWISSGNSTWLIKMMVGKQFDLNAILNDEYIPDQLTNYKGEEGNILPLIYQSGYLTLKGTEKGLSGMINYTLDIPNNEVKESFYSLFTDRYLGQPDDTTYGLLLRINRQLQKGDIDALLREIKKFFANIPYDVNRQSQDFEAHYQYTMWLIILLLTNHKCDIEEKTNVGRIDMVLQTDTHVYIFEFKLDKSADEAFNQIDTKRYADKFDLVNKQVVKIGVNFSSQTRTIEDWKKIPS